MADDNAGQEDNKQVSGTSLSVALKSASDGCGRQRQLKLGLLVGFSEICGGWVDKLLARMVTTRRMRTKRRRKRATKVKTATSKRKMKRKRKKMGRRNLWSRQKRRGRWLTQSGRDVTAKSRGTSEVAPTGEHSI